MDSASVTAVVRERAASLDPAPEVAALIESSIAPEPGQTPIKEGYSAELDELVRRAQEARTYIANLEAKERHATGIRSLRVGHNKVYGYYLEVSKGALSDVPDRYMRKQTLTTGERYSTTELQDAESLILNAEEAQGGAGAADFRGHRAKRGGGGTQAPQAGARPCRDRCVCRVRQGGCAP